jgi:hypothetical protein
MRTQHECMHVPAGLDEVLCVECVCRQVRSAHALQLNILQNATKQNTMRQHDQKNTQSFAGETTPSHRRQQTFRCACASATRPTVPTVDGGCGRADTLNWPICGHAIARTIRKSDHAHHTTTHNSRVNNAAASRVRCRRERCDRACCCRGLGDHTRPQHRPNDHGHGEEPRHRGCSHTPPSKMMSKIDGFYEYSRSHGPFFPDF